MTRQPARTPALTEGQALGDAKAAAFRMLLECLDLSALNHLSPHEAREQIEAMTAEIFRLGVSGLPASLEAVTAAAFCDDLLGLGPLEPFMSRDDVTDIMVNGPDSCFIDTPAGMERAAIHFASREHLTALCQRAVSRAGRRVDASNPVCDARLPDGSRLNVILPPLAADGPVLTIRKFRRESFTLEALEAAGSAPREATALIRAAVNARLNILVTGGAGSGKTTLLNCLSALIGEGERVIACEDAAELRLQHGHVVRLETRPANFEGEGEISMTALIRNALRMRPDRLIVGEVRGAEALDLLQAMNTGHDGSMGTLHANSPQQALARLETLALMAAPQLAGGALMRLIGGAIGMIVHMERRNGHRRIASIAQVKAGGDGVEAREIFAFELEERRTPAAARPAPAVSSP